MNRKKNWTAVTAYVVLALASLASIAMSAPHRDQRTFLVAPLDCDEGSWTRHAQYLAATEWVLAGTDVPNELSVSCAEVNQAAPFGHDSGYWERFAQYQAPTALAEQERTFTVAPFGYDSGYW